MHHVTHTPLPKTNTHNSLSYTVQLALFRENIFTFTSLEKKNFFFSSSCNKKSVEMDKNLQTWAQVLAAITVSGFVYRDLRPNWLQKANIQD